MTPIHYLFSISTQASIHTFPTQPRVCGSPKRLLEKDKLAYLSVFPSKHHTKKIMPLLSSAPTGEQEKRSKISFCINEAFYIITFFKVL